MYCAKEAEHVIMILRKKITTNTLADSRSIFHYFLQFIRLQSCSSTSVDITYIKVGSNLIVKDHLGEESKRYLNYVDTSSRYDDTV